MCLPRIAHTLSQIRVLQIPDAAVASFPDETSTEPDELEMSFADDSPVPTPPMIEEVPTTPPDFSPKSEDDDGMDID